MKNFNLVRFEKDISRGDDRISINLDSIRLPAAFMRKNAVESFEYAALFYDKENKAIGISLTNEKRAGVAKITKDRFGANLSVHSFLKANGIDPVTHRGKYQWVKIDYLNVGEVFVFELKK